MARRDKRFLSNTDDSYSRHTMRMQRLAVLDPDEIARIHEASLRILSTTGVRVESARARELLSHRGAKPRGSGSHVNQLLFPPDLVEDSLKLVPPSFSLHGPDGTFRVDVSTEGTVFASQGSPTKVFDERDPSTPRDATVADFVSYLRVLDALPRISVSHLDVWPLDVDYGVMHACATIEWAKCCRKPFGMGCRGREASQDVINIARAIAEGTGERQSIEKHPRLIAFFNPISPLRLPEGLLDGLLVFVTNKQPTIIAPAACAGTTAPMTIAGLLAQTNAEILATVTIAQLAEPGTPLLYGCVNSVLDPVTGNVAWGSPETGLITTAAAQLARFYHMPSRAAGAVTNANALDMQNGIERAMSLFMSTAAGVNYLTCAGTYASLLVSSLELLAIDDELAGACQRAVDGISVSGEALALGEIDTIAGTEGKSYLTSRHTQKAARKELFIPRLSDRLSHDTWVSRGMPGIIENARARVRDILAEPMEIRIPAGTVAKLEGLYEEIEKRGARKA
ncbi:MAG: trimethylamine methyltransferase family protein [Candidatus Lokiarchaeota archaeon]|nr:trimethylamine methyltransferase family protein [Candidatus Lokiarchaeota archaeon]